MKRKSKIKDAVSLKAQAIVHDKLSEDADVDVSEHTKDYWKKEALKYRQQMEDIIRKAGFPESYLEEIDRQAREKGRRLYLKKKKELNRVRRK
jgi:dissimilatory sulfite reductase (desulfoviridin) alpha/beta subunit